MGTGQLNSRKVAKLAGLVLLAFVVPALGGCGSDNGYRPGDCVTNAGGKFFDARIERADCATAQYRIIQVIDLSEDSSGDYSDRCLGVPGRKATFIITGARYLQICVGDV